MMRKLLATIACSLALALAPAASADGGDPKRSTILVKAISFDLDLDERIGDALVVGIVYRKGDPSSLAVADAWMAAFAQLGSLRIKNAPVRAVEIPWEPGAPNTPGVIDDAVKKDGVDALLVCDGLDEDLENLGRFALAHRLLTIGAKRAFMNGDHGLILGVFYEDDKPRIVVNLQSARAGGFRFSSAMLRLAVLVK